MSATDSALAALHHAGDFTKSVEGHSQSQFAPKPSGQHSEASYKMAAPKKTTGEDIAAGLKWNQTQVDDYAKQK